MTVAIIDYGSGNLRSCAKAFEHVAGDARVEVTADPRALSRASHIVLPGVGAFADCVRGLQAVPGMIEALGEHALTRKKPFLGICVGMQMLLEEGHEHGVHQGLGWIKGKVVKLADGKDQPPTTNHHPPLKIPHMGWNELRVAPHKLLEGIESGAHAYFVHSYHALCANPAHVLATTDYGGEVAAVIGRENIWGTQFHPEKSQETGLRLLKNFLVLGA